MASLDIPPAVSENVDNSTTIPPLNDYDSQKKSCLEAIAKIGPKCSSACVFFTAPPDGRLINELESKGYRVTYTLDYDSSRDNKFNCKIRIVNPSIQDPGTAFLTAFEDNMKKIGFAQDTLDTEESFKKLFNNLMNI